MWALKRAHPTGLGQISDFEVLNFGAVLVPLFRPEHRSFWRE
jgi:hypothetical protein